MAQPIHADFAEELQDNSVERPSVYRDEGLHFVDAKAKALTHLVMSPALKRLYDLDACCGL